MSAALEIAKATLPVKLDLASGQSPREGFEGVDIWDGAKHVVDLWKFPWPWEDNSVDELHCSHHIEHIPARTVEKSDLRPQDAAAPSLFSPAALDFIGKDMFFAFFDECYRIMKHEAWMLVLCPCARNNRAFQDPTHRRFIVAETFLYLSEEWRKINKLDHYRVKCNFGVDIVPIVPMDLTLLHPEAQARRFNESWNTVIDWQAKLKALKPSATAP